MRLGRVQRGVLKALADHGQYPGGWAWASHSTTVRTLDSLVRKGLAEREDGVYRITDEGRRAVAR